MGTLLWQMNDCWPVTSWSITDYNRQPKAAWYAVKEAYRDDKIPQKDVVHPRDLKLEKPTFSVNISGDSLLISSDVFAKYIYVSLKNKTAVFSDNYFDLEPGIAKIIFIKHPGKLKSILAELKIISLYDVSTR
jgi:beta-mannosidase